MILYYPLPEYKRALRNQGYQLINKVKVPGAEDPREKFLIYRYTPSDAPNVSANHAQA